MSKYGDQQYHWRDDLRQKLIANLSMTKIFKITQDQYLSKRKEIYNSEKRLSRENKAYVDGYLKCAEENIFSQLFHVRRIIGKPETASNAKWDDMTEELRQACQDHNTESCLSWDDKGEFPYFEWHHE